MKVQSASPYEERYGFSRAVRQGSVVHVAGTAPIPQDGSPCPQNAYDQMVLCGEIAVAALRALDADVTDVVRTRMYITDAADADDVGRGHRTVFGTAAPASTMIIVAGLLDPAWKVEIEVEARIG